ncbi:MAG: BlaI/MecI/CopY family transcriptional regulator [Flavobacteriales bacterium]|nr:BlaI/MecI/CopY family transcriptional regulator [Flavobacteriales bacterium]
MQELTKAEEQIMQVIWNLEKCFVKEIIPHLPEPQPAYNTVSTIVRILEKKEFVGYEAFGKTHQYFPIVSKEDYATYKTDSLLGNYFGNSVEKMMSFFVKEKKLDINELDELLKNLKNDE